MSDGQPDRAAPSWRVGLAVTSRTMAAVVGGLAFAVAASVCLALVVPDRRGLGLALGLLLLIPIWTTVMCLGFLAKSPWKPWLIYGAGAAVLAAAAWLTA